MLEVRLLGDFEVRRAGERVVIPSRPAQSLLAFLILNAGKAYRREQLAGQLWPESTDESARDYLRHAIWRIRKALGSTAARGKEAPFVLADDIQLSFNPASPYSLDTAILEKTSPDRASADELLLALSVYRGDLLPGFYDEWVVLERQRLQFAFEARIARLLQLLEQENRWSEILDWAEKWLAIGQRPEAAYRHMMSAHAAQGDMSRMAATYERCRTSLAGLGVEPSARTRQLYDELRSNRQDRISSVVQEPAAPARKENRSRIPVPLTSFVGRETELKEVSKLLSSTRLLTLTGSGGVGKTRLALRSAHDAIPRFKDGVFWVELVGLSDGELIPQQIAQVLGLNESAQAPKSVTLLDALRTKELLLILDNCEHLVQASAKLAEQILAACPKIRILATSRERLGIFSETTWPVPSLSEDSSVKLFTERARAARHDFSVPESNVAVVRQICERLDRIPLAIELAAARVSILSVDEIAQHLDDRFALLTSGSRTARSHQQTLRGTIDWSHDLLSPQERMLFRRLAVFSGGFELKALERVCGGDGLEHNASIDLLARLVDKSLVIPESSSSGAGSRFHMLETIRQYAEERLRETDETRALRDRHLDYFLALNEEAEPDLRGPKQYAWFNRLEAELDNLRAALLWSIMAPENTDGDVAGQRLEKAMRLAGALNNFWERNHRREALELIEQVLKHAAAPGPGRAKALVTMGFLYWASTEHEKAKPYLEQACTSASQLGQRTVLAWAESHLGAVMIALGEYDSARQHLEIARRLCESLPEGGRLVLGWTLAFLGDIPFAQGDEAAAQRLYLEAKTLANETYDINTLTYCSRRLGYLALKQGQHSDAEGYFRASLGYNQEISHAQGINRCVAAFACLRAAQGKSEQATQLCGSVEAFLASTSASLFHWDEEFFRLNVSRLQEDMPEVRFKKAWARGFKMDLEEAVEFALATG